MKPKKKFKLRAYTDTLSGTCGVGLVFDYENHNALDAYTKRWTKPFEKSHLEGGAGWSIAGFVNDSPSIGAYEFFKKNVQIVFQAPVRVNKNSSNEFFFIVVDATPSSKEVDNSNFEWPVFTQQQLDIDSDDTW